ncbi:MAG TPA: hypothetical protein VI431_01585 [Candidatus Acidoferrum sp.]
MKPQPFSLLGRIVVPILSLAAILAVPYHAAAAPPACTSANISPGPNDPVAFVVAATSPGAVSVFDLATNTVVCSIAVGNNPSHLAFSADSSFLLVENDADATVSVINLSDGSTAATLSLSPTVVTAGASGITGNIAATFDGTHSFAYIAVYPNPLPATPTPVLGRINLDVSPPTLALVGPLTNGATPPATGDIGVAFSPDGSKAFITFDGNTNVFTTSTNTFSASIPVTGGSFAVSPVGDLGYVVQTAATASSAAPNQITIATNAIAATGAASGQSVCSRSNTTTTSPDGTLAYYSCPANNSLQFITASSNQVTNTVNLKTVGSGPNGIAATSDGSLLLVANNNSTISVFTSPTTTPVEANFVGPGGALAGIDQRPVLPVIAPSTAQNVVVNKTIQFTATTAYAINPAKNIASTVWKVNNVVGGNSTVGTISTSGLYTAPATPPTPATVTVTATVSSSEFFLNSKLYPGQSGSVSVTVTVLLPISVAVSPKPSSLDLSTATTVQLTGTVNNDPAAKGVTWAVNGVTPGTTTTGTVSPTSTASGTPTTYTAPKMISPPSSVQITATSVSDPTASDTSTLTLSSGITFSPIVFTPAGPLLIENTDTLSTSLTGDPYSQGVTWSIVGCSAATPATAACGSINNTTNPGLFTPPPIVPYASQSNPVAPATITFLATSVTDTSKTSQTSPIQITSNVSFTGTPGFQVNGAPPPAQLLIETAAGYALTATLTGDTGQGVKWSISSCSADPAGGPLCGLITASGTYTPPKIVPYASPVTPASVATVTFTATSIADVLISKTFAINIGSTVAITGYNINGAAPAPPLLIETASYTLTPVISGDTGQGVTWTILNCSAATPSNSSCGKFNNATTGVYAPPSIVPYALPVTSSSTASIAFQVTSVADPKVIFQPTAIAISSNISITGYNVNGTVAPPTGFQFLIETPSYNLTPVINNDTGQGATWSILSCSADSAGGLKCGSTTPAGAYAPPAIVPYALPVTSSSVAFVTFQAVSTADPKVVFQTNPPGQATISSLINLKMASPSALIGSNVDFTPVATASGNNVNMGTGASQSDLTLGVTLAISGTCVAPPNYSFSAKDGNGCGSFNGSQNNGNPPALIYTYTAPAVVPMSASCAASPAGCLGTQNKASIIVAATSIADPKQSASTTFMISSNISFGVALGTDATTMKNTCNPFVYAPTDLTHLTSDPCGFLANAPTLAIGFTAALNESNAIGFGTVTGLTWTPSGSLQPASGTQTMFTAPSAVPSGGSATITSYAIADFTKTAAFTIPIVASKLIPHNIAPPFGLTVASGQPSGTISLDFQGPTSGTVAFSCPSFSNLTSSTCSFSPNPANAAGTTTVTMTLSVTRAGGTPSQPPPAPRIPLPGLPGTVLATILLVLLILAFGTRNRASWANVSRWNTAIIFLVLCSVALTWAAACAQFSAPTVPPPLIPPTQAATGSATVMAAPTTDSSPSTDSLAVPATVQ